MNYYKRHLGDYAAATRHLSMIEHGAYTLLLDLCYITERPLPADEKQVYRLAGARTPAEKEAVKQVLSEFFTLADDGWRQARCDAEIADAQEAASESSSKKENEKERQRRHRERRKAMFDTLREHGIVPPWDTPLNELETHLSRVTGVAGHAPETCTATAIHKPLANNHKKEKEEAAAAPPPHTPVHTHAHEDGPNAPPLSAPADSEPMQPHVRYAVLLRTWERERGKASRTTSADPRLSAWADRGITEGQLREAYDLAVADREIAGDTGPISAGFLDVFLAKLQQQANGGKGSALDRQPKGAASSSDPLAWAMTWSGIVAKGAELGLEQGPGEIAPDFKARVHAAAGITTADKSRLLADYGVRA
ncbi:YdaU family protein [Pseudomonas sp. S 311-6]|nr:hypothetical protein CBF45_12700 [Bordetella sp. J329]MCO7642544.1 YdaU family protein [Pseudomonas sp. S 311-6]